MRGVMLMLFLVIAGWAAGLLFFVQRLPQQPTPASVRTDAIIVLTGGSARVERGFAMLAQGAAPVLMISGVGKDVTLQEMLYAHADSRTRDAIVLRGASIVLDHVARTTQTNAREIAQFAQERQLRSARIITADYHMARSLAEIRTALPEVELVPDAVQPSGFKRDQWWRHKTSRELVLSEYHKTIAVLVRSLLPAS
jgi:uncharacterized SAM-binding protein YcdF (DUF218 family)